MKSDVATQQRPDDRQRCDFDRPLSGACGAPLRARCISSATAFRTKCGAPVITTTARPQPAAHARRHPGAPETRAGRAIPMRRSSSSPSDATHAAPIPAPSVTTRSPASTRPGAQEPSVGSGFEPLTRPDRLRKQQGRVIPPVTGTRQPMKTHRRIEHVKQQLRRDSRNLQARVHSPASNSRMTASSTAIGRLANSWCRR